MKEPFANLDTNAIDEQIEQILQAAPNQRGRVDSQYLRDLQYLYRKEQILARAGQRLMFADSMGESAGTSAVSSQLSKSGVMPVVPGMFTRTNDTAPMNRNSQPRKRAFAPFASYSRIQRHLLVNASAALTLMVIVAFALLAVSSLDRNTGVGSRPAATHSTQKTPGTEASVIATATAQQQNNNTTPTATSGITISNGSQSLPWPLGQSTYWANLRYHQLTGHWVQWHGNADQWVTGARAAGWDVSPSPHVPSIIVVMPYVQRAGEYGHVGVVESIVTSEKAHTSNMDWPVDGGGWNKVSDYDFTVGLGVYFIWKA